MQIFKKNEKPRPENAVGRIGTGLASKCGNRYFFLPTLKALSFGIRIL